MFVKERKNLEEEEEEEEVRKRNTEERKMGESFRKGKDGEEEEASW